MCGNMPYMDLMGYIKGQKHGHHLEGANIPYECGNVYESFSLMSYFFVCSCLVCLKWLNLVV